MAVSYDEQKRQEALQKAINPTNDPNAFSVGNTSWANNVPGAGYNPVTMPTGQPTSQPTGGAPSAPNAPAAPPALPIAFA